MAVRRLANGKWQVDFYVGKSRKRKAFDTRNQALSFDRSRKLLEIRPRYSEITIEEAVNEYKRKCTSSKIGGRQNEIIYFKRLTDHLVVGEGLKFVDDVRFIHMEALQLRLKAIKAPDTVNRHFHTYKHFFNKCIDWDYRESNPCSKVKALSFIRKKRGVWTDKQQQAMIDNAPAWAADIAFVFSRTGIRPIQLCRLTWDGVDFERMTITTVSYKGQMAVEVTTPMSIDVLNFLTARRHQENAGKSELVFRMPDGSAVSNKSLSRTMSRVRRALGFDGLDFYGFRHTMVSRITSSHGIHTASIIAGHKSVVTTEKFYVSADDKKLHEAVNHHAVVKRKVEP